MLSRVHVHVCYKHVLYILIYYANLYLFINCYLSQTLLKKILRHIGLLFKGLLCVTALRIASLAACSV